MSVTSLVIIDGSDLRECFEHYLKVYKDTGFELLDICNRNKLIAGYVDDNNQIVGYINVNIHKREDDTIKYLTERYIIQAVRDEEGDKLIVSTFVTDIEGNRETVMIYDRLSKTIQLNC